MIWVDSSFMVNWGVHSWREELSIVKRAGNSWSPARGSFLGVAAILGGWRFGMFVVDGDLDGCS